MLQFFLGARAGAVVRAAALLALMAFVAARISTGVERTVDWPVIRAAGHDVRVVTIAKGLARPWALAFLPDGRMLVTERPGRLRLVADGLPEARSVDGVPVVHAEDHGGLLDVALHPRFAENSWVYLSYTKPGPQGTTVAVARGRLDGESLVDVADIFVADAWRDVVQVQFGGKLAFADGHLYLTVGDRAEAHRAQLLSDHAGTVVRLRDDGTVPLDNPFVGRPDARPEIYSYGHRNPQGLVLDPASGILWAHEHGPQGGDELNRLLPGANYGWPLVTYGRDYTGAAISDRACRDDLEPPVLLWSPSIGISGMTLYTGSRFPAWHASLFVGALAARHLERIVFSDEGPVDRERILSSLEHRIRDVRQGPDDLLYVLTDGDDGAVLRLEPADQPS